MNKVILDGSALLCLLNEQPGVEIIEPLLTSSIMSSVAIAEITNILANNFLIPKDNLSKILCLISEIYPFTDQDALETGLLNLGKQDLSTAQRAGLALAIKLKLPIYTCNPAWQELNLPVEIIIVD